MNTQENEPTTMVIFGATGDLGRRKLIPALFDLYRSNRLPDDLMIWGIASTQRDNENFRVLLRESVIEASDNHVLDEAWDGFAEKLYYHAGRFNEQTTYLELSRKLDNCSRLSGNILFYAAVYPEFFIPITTGLNKVNLLVEDHGWRRVVIEKPFGHDLISARALNLELRQNLNENQIFRIDHYLGKETVQNILTFRFENVMYEPLWNHRFIDHIQITVAESLDVENRGKYYDHVGVLKDMFQNHLLQLLCLVTMDPPENFTSEKLHKGRLEILNHIRPFSVEDIEHNTVRGQYNGYLDSPDVRTDSQTETFAAIEFHIDHPRWQGVNFYLRSGKALKEKITEIVIQFKSQNQKQSDPSVREYSSPNLLSFCIQPDEGFHQRFRLKEPDTVDQQRSVDMVFHYRDIFGKSAIPEAYNRLLLDAFAGDTTLFTQGEWIEKAWEIIDPISHTWRSEGNHLLYRYSPGSWGPEAAKELLRKTGREWQRVCAIHQ